MPYHAFIRSVLTALAIILFFAAAAAFVFIFIKWFATGRNVTTRAAGIVISLWASFLGADMLLHLIGS